MERMITCAGQQDKCGGHVVLWREDLPGNYDFHLWTCDVHHLELELSGTIDEEVPGIELMNDVWIKFHDCEFCGTAFSKLEVWEKTAEFEKGRPDWSVQFAGCAQCDARP